MMKLPPMEMGIILGIILGIVVLLEAALIRLLLLPVLRLTGNAAWTAPACLRRVLPEVRFNH